jgi:uracil-DNA glycosylase
MSANSWVDLKFWESGEFQVILERLSDLEKKGIQYCPDYNRQTLKRDKLFKALELVPFDKVRVVLLGQDPYPDKTEATGVAFEVPWDCTIIPLSLANIFRELTDDLQYPYPVQTRRLTPWLNQGVLLLNMYYTCLESYPDPTTGKQVSGSGTHLWSEYAELTKQILNALGGRSSPPVVVLMGGKAHTMETEAGQCKVIKVSHPSPLGVTKANPAKGKLAFRGSRIFSSINAALVDQGQEPINWKLP